MIRKLATHGDPVRHHLRLQSEMLCFMVFFVCTLGDIVSDQRLCIFCFVTDVGHVLLRSLCLARFSTKKPISLDWIYPEHSWSANSVNLSGPGQKKCCSPSFAALRRMHVSDASVLVILPAICREPCLALVILSQPTIPA